MANLAYQAQRKPCFALCAPVVETLTMLGDFITSVLVSERQEFWVKLAVAMFVLLKDFKIFFNCSLNFVQAKALSGNLGVVFTKSA